MADPKWIDITIDSNGRSTPNWCFMGVPETVNNSPAGLARYSSLRSWLSQWLLKNIFHFFIFYFFFILFFCILFYFIFIFFLFYFILFFILFFFIFLFLLYVSNYLINK